MITTRDSARFAALTAGLLTAAFSLEGHDLITTKLTYTRDISRVFGQHCIGCHGSASTIPLTNYTQVRPWAVAIKEQVLARSMPPWGAVRGFGNLASERALSEEDMLVIAAWVVGGAPQGDPSLSPKKAAAPEAASQTSVPDRHQEFVTVVNTTLTLARDAAIQGIRPLPDNRVGSVKIVAHLPGGRVEPLLWLYGYDPSWHTLFRCAEKMQLPAGTTVTASAPLRFELFGGR